MNDVNKNILDAILDTEDAKEAVTYAVNGYAKQSVENARNLIQLISSLTDIAIEHKQKEVIQNREALFWLMVQHETNKIAPSTLFALMVPVCMACFPDGTADDACQAEKEYFAKFLELFKNKKVFSWEKDSVWAHTNGYTDYLKIVERKIKFE